MSDLHADLSEADVSAGALRARFGVVGPPTEADLAAARPGGPLGAWSHDLGEVLDQIAVAGLAYPDPDLPAALDALADEAVELALSSPVAPLLRLAVCLRRCGPEAADDQRREAGVVAFEQVQILTAWLRMFRREQALLVVDAQLAALGEAAAPTRHARVPTRSLEAWVDGLAFAAGRLTLLARDRESGAPVLIRDAVPDFDVVDPFARPYLSRLFQSAVALEEVLEGLIVFEDHPVALRNGALVFTPAFQVAASLRPVTEAFVPPPLPPAEPGSRRPGLLAAEWRRGAHGPLLWLVEHQVALPTAEAPILALNAVKALTLHERLPLTLCVIDGPDGARVLNARLGTGARIFPAIDPTILRWQPERLVQATADGSPWLRGAAAIYGGAAAGLLAELAAWWPEAPSVPSLWRATYLRWALGLPAPDFTPDVEAVLDLALRAATRASDCTPAELARIHGVPVGALGAAARRIDGRIAFMALWLLALTDGLHARMPALRGLFQVRYATLDEEPSVHDICVRALLMAAIAEETAEDGDLAPEDALRPTLDYLQAHVSSFVRRPGQAEPRPLPPLDAVLALADTWARLNGGDPRVQPVARLGLDRTALGAAIARALYAWRREGAPGSTAADALWVAAHSGLARWFIAPAGTELFEQAE